MRNKKGQGLSISTLVIIALAVFVIFLLIGFVTSGWGYFTDMFGGSLQQEPTEAARLKCAGFCATWKGAGSPDVVRGTHWNEKLCLVRTDMDTTGDGKDNDYYCTGTEGVLSAAECTVTCPPAGFP